MKLRHANNVIFFSYCCCDNLKYFLCVCSIFIETNFYTFCFFLSFIKNILFVSFLMNLAFSKLKTLKNENEVILPARKTRNNGRCKTTCGSEIHGVTIKTLVDILEPIVCNYVVCYKMICLCSVSNLNSIIHY